MCFADGTLSSCTETSLISLKDIELCFQNTVFLKVFVSFASISYNPNTGIKDPHFNLKF